MALAMRSSINNPPRILEPVCIKLQNTALHVVLSYNYFREMTRNMFIIFRSFKITQWISLRCVLKGDFQQAEVSKSHRKTLVENVFENDVISDTKFNDYTVQLL